MPSHLYRFSQLRLSLCQRVVTLPFQLSHKGGYQAPSTYHGSMRECFSSSKRDPVRSGRKHHRVGSGCKLRRSRELCLSKQFSCSMEPGNCQKRKLLITLPIGFVTSGNMLIKGRTYWISFFPAIWIRVRSLV